MQLDVMDVTARVVAVVVLLLAVVCIVCIWSAALGAPVFHIPGVEAHTAAGA